MWHKLLRLCGKLLFHYKTFVIAYDGLEDYSSDGDNYRHETYVEA